MNYRPLLPEYNWLFFELSPSFLAANSPDTMSELPLPGGEALRSGGDCRLAALNCRRSTMYDQRGDVALSK